MDEMKPCPFCRAETNMHTHKDDYGNYYVVCGNCGAQGPPSINQGFAYELWDQRDTES